MSDRFENMDSIVLRYLVPFFYVQVRSMTYRSLAADLEQYCVRRVWKVLSKHSR